MCRRRRGRARRGRRGRRERRGRRGHGSRAGPGERGKRTHRLPDRASAHARAAPFADHSSVATGNTILKIILFKKAGIALVTELVLRGPILQSGVLSVFYCVPIK